MKAAASSSRAGSRYFCLRPLASGGMASVELALQVSSGGFERLVVVKRIRPELAATPQMVAMFMEEARIAALLNHPNLIHAYELCEEDAGMFLAMEHLRGQPFSNILDLAGTSSLDLRFSLEVLIQALEGLQHAHQLTGIDGRPLGLVHRDISPSNLFVTYAGHVKVLDFGIAKTHTSSVETEAGIVKGKAHYMAPEQALEQPLDGRADVYSVGTMLWEAIANRSRWGDLPYQVVLGKLMQDREPEPPGAAARGLPSFFDRVTTRALAFDPDARFQSAAELKAALIALADHLGARPTAKQMADYVGERFELQRAQEQRTIDEELAAFREQRDGASRAPHKTRIVQAGTRALAEPARVEEAAAADGSGQLAVETNVGDGSGPRLKAAAPPRSRLWLVGLGALLLGAAVSWLSVAGRGQAPSEAHPARSAPEVAKVLVAPPPSAEVAPAVTAEPALAATPVPSSSAAPVASARPARVARPAKVRKTIASPAKPTKKGLELDRSSPW
jgi:serine/threonine-protein kinase